MRSGPFVVGMAGRRAGEGVPKAAVHGPGVVSARFSFDQGQGP